jgi:hypothetical protein
MIFLRLTAILSLAALVGAATTSGQITWASVVFTYHGERVPFLEEGPYDLTPLGANQMLQSGQLVRSRYIDPPSNGSQLTLGMPINGIYPIALDNTQFSILSTDDQYISTSAMAFMQGLYPPAFILDAESEMGNGTVEQYPLGGYKYPNVQTFGTNDYNYIW